MVSPSPGTLARVKLIDPGDMSTWPEDVQGEVEALIERCREVQGNDPATSSCDLRLEYVDAVFAAERAFRELLGSRPVALYHATRLLPHALKAVRQDGLVVLDEDHRSRRLDRVIDVYGNKIGADRLGLLRTAGPLSWDREQRDGRLGQLFGVTPLQATFDDAGDGMTVFLENWGGESFYWAAEESEELAEVIDLLTARSTPVIVELGVHAGWLNTYTDLWKVFVGQLGGWPRACQVFSLSGSVPPDRIERLLVPTSDGWPDLGDWDNG
jgi:hypothetical protein